MEAIKSEIRQLETEEFSSKIDELNKGLKPVENSFMEADGSKSVRSATDMHACLTIRAS